MWKELSHYGIGAQLLFCDKILMDNNTLWGCAFLWFDMEKLKQTGKVMKEE